MIYRECTNDDFHKLLPLFGQLWPDQQLSETAMKEVFIKGIYSENHHYLCVENDDKIVGFCSLTIKNNLWQQGKLGHIDKIVIDETSRGQGIGKELLNRISQIARSMGCKRIELDSAHHRIEAQEFYKKNGFDNRAILFSKSLNSHRDREAPHSAPLPHHAAYGSVLRGSADQAGSDPGEQKPK